MVPARLGRRVNRVAEVVAPARLGVGFRWLLSSSWISNLGDGIAIAAGPLLVASLTDEAFLVAMAALLQWLPPLLFWALLLTTPLGIAHAVLGDWLIEGAGSWFWPAALIDGPLSVAAALLGFALTAEAYRRVARG